MSQALIDFCVHKADIKKIVYHYNRVKLPTYSALMVPSEPSNRAPTPKQMRLQFSPQYPSLPKD